MKKLIVANLKMHGTKFEIEELINQYNQIKTSHAQVVLCLPYPYLYLFKSNNISLGAQDVSNKEVGAFTGQVSAEMLADFKVDYCLVGHAERRKYNAENTMQCYEKILQLLKHNITPILCVGENAKQREEGLTLKTLKKQVSGALKRLSPEDIKKVVIAYEPIWAIKNIVKVNPEEINNINIEILKIVAKLLKQPFQDLQIPIIYGGAVNQENANEILSKKFVGGLIAGRFCLTASKFIEMCNNI